MFRKFIAAVVLVSGVGLAGVANAGTISLTNNFSFNDTDLILTDGNSGLEWLNLTKTIGRSYEDISGKLGSGGEFEGWTYASGALFTSMVGHWAGSSRSSSVGITQYNDDIIDGLIPFLGDTYGAVNLQPTTDAYIFGSPEDRHFSYGFTSTRTDGFITYWGVQDFEESGAGIDHSGLLQRTLDTYAGPVVGSFLVREVSVVPLPPSAILFGTALFGLGYMHRRKRKQAT